MGNPFRRLLRLAARRLIPVAGRVAHARRTVLRWWGVDHTPVLPITDREATTPPAVVYVICATPRCGSTLLCEALWRTGLLGRPREYFLPWQLLTQWPQTLNARLDSWRVPTRDYIQGIMTEGATLNGVFGVKMMWGNMNVVLARLRALPSLRRLRDEAVLPTLWPGLRYIHIVRRDKVRQAVSWAKAMQSGQWGDRDMEVAQPQMATEVARRFPPPSRAWRGGLVAARPGATLRYDPAELKGLYQTLLNHEQAWEAYFRAAGVVPIRVVYEDLATTDSQTAVSIGRLLGVDGVEDPPPLPRTLRRQADALNDDWAVRFSGDLARS